MDEIGKTLDKAIFVCRNTILQNLITVSEGQIVLIVPTTRKCAS